MDSKCLENELNSDDADFGDFQTCAQELSPTVQTEQKSLLNQTNVNIFQLDAIQFQQFLTDLEVEIATYFDNVSPPSTDNDGLAKSFEEHFPPVIKPQEDTVNDCPIWWNLTESFDFKPPLKFQKSHTFRFYTSALKLGKKSSINKKCDLPANIQTSKAHNELIDEEELANDLDMHSLIIGSVEQQLNNRCEVVNADQVIEDIETMMSNGNLKDQLNGKSKLETGNVNKLNSILSLNASSLLDAALHSWQLNDIQHGSGVQPNQQMLSIHEEMDDSQFHSLPANLNNTFSSLDNSLISNDSDLNDSLISLKASNIVLTSKLLETNDENISKCNKSDEIPSKSNNVSDLYEKLKRLSIVQLNELYMELEQIIRIQSEVLIQELALRDELEFEKELKNTFISLLLSVQNKRRHYSSTGSSANSSPIRRVNGGRKTNRFARRNSNDTIRSNTSSSIMSRALDLTSLGTSIKESFLFSSSPSTPVYLTTVIPYKSSMNPLDVPTLEILIKLLRALNEDSSTVPALLTDYILKVICP